ncbi:D123-domain-containing protein [Coniochaeta sp. PMI_546]|nr:D123-domain-containing protein [Coniochaeta sp. PMI_546]
MPAFENLSIPEGERAQATPVQFPPVSREHILHCSYDSWFPKYRTSCIRSRVIPLTPEFIQYIREDRIILADDDETHGANAEDDDWEPTVPSRAPERRLEDDDSDSEDGDEAIGLPPNQRFPELHQTIKDKIRELGGAVAPKLNWSAPKDAAWISQHQNTMKCTSPNDIYLLLKSSSFVSHDLEHPFDSCTPPPPPASSSSNSDAKLSFTPVLVLRSFFSPLPSLEFRCFVKDRTLVGITQRDLNHYAFLLEIKEEISARVQELFNRKLRFTFPEASFAFDVYIPEADYNDDDSDDGRGSRLGRARLIDINPWAPHTDTLLFGWDELLDIRVPKPVLGTVGERDGPGAGDTEDDMATTDDDEDDDEADYVPEVRLVEKDDPAAYNFSAPTYSAHKLPKEVVDASMAGEGGIREFARRWHRFVEGGDARREWETSDTEN